MLLPPACHQARPPNDRLGYFLNVAKAAIGQNSAELALANCKGTDQPKVDPVSSGVMVAESQTQGVLSQNGTCDNGTPISASPNGSSKTNGSCVTVEAPSHISEFYPKNNLGCSDGRAKCSLIKV